MRSGATMWIWSLLFSVHFGHILYIFHANTSIGARRRNCKLCCFLQYALWGNKTDLSLFSASTLDTTALAPGAARAAKAAAAADGGGDAISPLLVDEFPKMWEYFTAKGTGRVKGAE